MPTTASDLPTTGLLITDVRLANGARVDVSIAAGRIAAWDKEQKARAENDGEAGACECGGNCQG